MGKKIKLIFVFLLFECSSALSQTQMNVITIDVDDPQNFQPVVFSDNTTHYPIIDLLKIQGTALIYPQLESALIDELQNDPNSVTDVVVVIPFEEYIKGVVLQEIGRSSTPLEAMKALAVAARCFAEGIAQRRPPYSETFAGLSSPINFTVYGDIDDQDYLACVSSSPNYSADNGFSAQATDDTTGQALWLI